MLRDKKYTITKALYGAMLNYFQTKAAGGGMFPDKETKQRCLDAIGKAAKSFGVSVMPGLICFSDGKGRAAYVDKETNIGTTMVFKESSKAAAEWFNR